MSTAVRYYCPRCGTVVAVEREGYLADKSVTPYPLAGWTYVDPETFRSGGEDVASADGIRFVCGQSAGVEWVADGCGESFYLNFVRFEDGEEVEPTPEREYVELAGPGPAGPRGPQGPPGPG